MPSSISYWKTSLCHTMRSRAPGLSKMGDEQNDSINSSITRLLKLLVVRCPNVKPAIFPKYLKPSSVEDLFTYQNHRQQWLQWSSERNSSADFALITEMDFSNRTIRISEIKVNFQFTCSFKMRKNYYLVSRCN